MFFWVVKWLFIQSLRNFPSPIISINYSQDTNDKRSQKPRREVRFSSLISPILHHLTKACNWQREELDERVRRDRSFKSITHWKATQTREGGLFHFPEWRHHSNSSPILDSCTFLFYFIFSSKNKNKIKKSWHLIFLNISNISILLNWILRRYTHCFTRS